MTLSERLQVVAVGTCAVQVFVALHDKVMFVAVVPLIAALAVPRLRTNSWLWILMALVWVPRMITNWIHYEDHCYLAIYWTLGLGLALRDENPWEVLQHHARWMVGLVMGIAAVWKIAVPAFRDGSLFSLVLARDTRFAPLLSRVAGGVDETSWREGASAITAMMYKPDGPLSATWNIGPRTELVVDGMVAWTILIEVGMAVVFLAPNRWRTSALRAPLLLAFCWGLYPIVPILGFGLLLPMMGAVVDSERPLAAKAYMASMVAFVLIGLAESWHWQEAIADLLVG